jgi:hypothetical protein
VLTKEPSELALAEPEAARERVDIVAVERAELDERERARYRVRRTPPRAEIGRRLRPTAHARVEPSLLRRRRGGKEPHVLGARRARRTDRTAVDVRRLHRGDEPTVEARVALADGAIAGVVIQVHGVKVVPVDGLV